MMGECSSEEGRRRSAYDYCSIMRCYSALTTIAGAGSTPRPCMTEVRLMCVNVLEGDKKQNDNGSAKLVIPKTTKTSISKASHLPVCTLYTVYRNPQQLIVRKFVPVGDINEKTIATKRSGVNRSFYRSAISVTWTSLKIIYRRISLCIFQLLRWRIQGCSD